ncbi:protein-tyrosine-phosphatase [Caldovatus sediminis]|uniref:Protein-tyrosine-phosphatase n=1 Tax=Caldovatus sediminis TaxID=2041189 RepID=A0A8J2Z9A6_9PROT|nr:tyrosine-protein phosphatase [Caldovatus sediminis]GGG21181.1 protein-tyrosine-phosphatase [Caldovatus sediminis]
MTAEGIGEHDLPRRIALEGCTNLRDLGGYRAADGRRVRFGRVFRSASLARLTEGDLDILCTLGIRTICDLRGREESAAAPSRLPPRDPPALHALSIEPTVGASLADMLARGQATGEDVLGLLRRAYEAYATEHLHRYRAMFALLEDAARVPLLFHCSAGKDRTGFGAALVLTALGVPRETVIADYLATARFWKREFALPPGADPSAAAALLGVHRPLIERALDVALGPYDSEEAFFERALGFGPARLARLRDALLE